MPTAIAGFIAVLGTTGFAQWFKNVSATYTTKQVHTAVCIVAAAATIIWSFATSNPSFMNWLINTVIIATSSIGTYEMFLKGLYNTTVPTPPVASTAS